MTFTSENLSLPYIAPAQAQKHVTHNEALRMLDALVQLSLTSRAQTTPPGAPAAGERHFIAASASGAWAGKDGQIAAYLDGGWQYFTPQTGWQAWIADESAFMVWDGAGWAAISGGTPDLQNLAGLGIGTTSDAANKLAVVSDAVLLSHNGNGHQLKLNKNAAADTGSVLYQTGYSGRAEIGLTGDDDFHFKVSPDGTAWKDAIIIDKTSGEVSMPFTAFGSGGGSASGALGALQISNGASGFDGNAAQMVWDASNSRFGIGDATPDYTVDISIPSAALNIGKSGTGAPALYMRGNKMIGYYAGKMNFPDGVVIGAQNILDANYLVNLNTGSSTGGIIARAPSSGSTEIFKIRSYTGNTTHFAAYSDGAAYFKSQVRTDTSVKCGGFTVASLPSASASGAGAMIYVSDEAGGAGMAFSDGTNWRRMTDRAVVS